MTDVVGLCMMCGQPGTMHTCQLCGRQVCERCFRHRYLVCGECDHRRKHADEPRFPMD